MFFQNPSWKASSSDQEEVIEYKEFSSGKKSKKSTIVFSVAIVLLLILCAIFIILFAIKKRKEHELATQETAQPKICVSRRCLFAAVGMYTSLILIGSYQLLDRAQ